MLVKYIPQVKDLTFLGCSHMTTPRNVFNFVGTDISFVIKRMCMCEEWGGGYFVICLISPLFEKKIILILVF